MKVSLVIPCYNEEELVAPLLEELAACVDALAQRGDEAEVIIVDDGSSDGTWPALEAGRQGRAWLRLVQLRRNFGQTAAMAAGFDRATGDVVVPMDADLQNDPADVPMLLDKLSEGYDVVSGWRRNRHDGLWTRKIPSWVANWLIGRVCGVRIHDYGCTLKAYRREILQDVHLYGDMHRFIPVHATWAGARVTEVEVNHRPRRAGQSKYGMRRTFRVLLDLITVKFLGDYSTKPLRLFGGLGMVSCLGGVLAGVITLVQRQVLGADAAPVHRNPLILLAVMLFLLGMQFIMTGLVAELNVRTYHESQGKPIYTVRRELGLPSDPS